jgi:hypothetical protein
MKIKSFKQFLNEFEIEGEHQNITKVYMFDYIRDDVEYSIYVYVKANSMQNAIDKIEKYTLKNEDRNNYRRLAEVHPKGGLENFTNVDFDGDFLETPPQYNNI